MINAELLSRLIQIANEKFDGHFTILKFTGNWRVCFGTADTAVLDGNVHHMPVGKTFAEAAQAAIATNSNVYEYPDDAMVRFMADHPDGLVRYNPNANKHSEDREILDDIFEYLCSEEEGHEYGKTAYLELLAFAKEGIESILANPDADGSFFPDGKWRWSHHAELLEAAACIVSAIKARRSATKQDKAPE